MSILKGIARLFATFLLTAFVIGCETTQCPINNVVYSTYGFYTYADGTTEVPIQILDTLTVTAAGTDSVLINRLYNGSTIELPVSYNQPVDTLVFQFTDAQSQVREDTIWVYKENIPHYESPECPSAMFHYITDVRWTQLLINSVSIVNPNINYNVSENFKIYFHSGN